MIPAAAAPAPVEGVDFSLLGAVPGPLGLAVSGGSDSTALAVLAAEALPHRRLVILTVDHGLRVEAAEDAAAVEALGARLGLPVLTLRTRTRPAGSLQAWARRERYRLFAEAATREGLAAVALGHTLDDQAETFLLRLARGSGLRGLSAMRARTERDGLVLLRPLLGAGREVLRRALQERGVAWREDPSNVDPRFDRTAMRALLPRLSAVGLSSRRLAATAAHLARASDAVDHAVDALLAEAACQDRAGAVRLDLSRWSAAQREVRLRALAEVVHRAGGGEYPPRFDVLERAEAALIAGDARTTLGRAVLAASGGVAFLWREARDIRPLVLAPGGAGVFDGRFRVALAPWARPVAVDALGPAARSLPADAHRQAMETAPGLFAGETCVAAPTLGIRVRSWPRGAVTVTHVR